MRSNTLQISNGHVFLLLHFQLFLVFFPPFCASSISWFEDLSQLLNCWVLQGAAGEGEGPMTPREAWPCAAGVSGRTPEGTERARGPADWNEC